MTTAEQYKKFEELDKLAAEDRCKIRGWNDSACYCYSDWV